MLKIALSVATGEKYNTLIEKEFKPDIVALRSLNKDSDERYNRLKQILSEYTRSVLDQFKIDKKNIAPKKTEKKSFLGKLFN